MALEWHFVFPNIMNDAFKSINVCWLNLTQQLVSISKINNIDDLLLF